jgi:hypothetical protein
MSTLQERHRPWGRIIAGAIAAIILCISVEFFLSAAEDRHVADAAQVAEPIHLKVDLSKPGVYRGEFYHTFRGAHSDFLQIVPESPFKSHEEAVAIVKGLRGSVSIVGSDGTVVCAQRFGPDQFPTVQIENEGTFPLLGSSHFDFDEGVYELTLTVDQGAPGLAGVPHVLVGRYGLCGIEYMAAEIGWMIGVAGCVIAGIIVLAIVVVSLRKRSTPLMPDSAGKA